MFNKNARGSIGTGRLTAKIRENGRGGAVRLFSLLLCAVMLLSVYSQTAYAELPEPTEPVEVELNVYSTETDAATAEGVYFDNVFYVNTETLHELTGLRLLYTESDGTLEIHGFYSQRQMLLHPDGTGTERFGSETVTFACPYLTYGDEPYISLLHLLRYLDVPVTFAQDENEPVHLYITVPYTIYDAVAEYGVDTAFSWLEAAATQEDIEKYLTNAGAAILLSHYKVSFRRCFFDEAGVEQEVLQDGITRVIKEEGDDYADLLNSAMDGFNRTSAALSEEVDFIGYYTDVMKDLIKAGQKAGSVQAMDYLAGTAQMAGGVGNGISGLIDAITGISTYAEMTQLQRELLDKTVLSPQGTFIKGDYANYYAACENTKAAIAEANDGEVKTETLDAIIKALQGAGSDLLGEGLLGPVAIAIKAAPAVSTLMGNAEKDADLLAAQTALVMQDYAVSIYENKFADVRKHHWYLGQDWKENLKELQYDLILAVKASVAARHYTIRSDYSPLDHDSMERTNLKAASLLRRVEQAVILEPGKQNAYTGEDLHWIKELQLPRFGNSCNNINLGGIAAYDERTGAYFYRGDTTHKHKDGGYTFYTHDLCMEDRDGNVTVLSDQAAAGPCINVVRDWVYYRSGDSFSGVIRRVKTDGSGDTAVTDFKVNAFYVAFGQLFFVAPYEFEDPFGIYRSRLDGSERVLITELASDDHCDGIWIFSRDLLYYTKTSMAGGAVGFEGGPTGLFRAEVRKAKDADTPPDVKEEQLREGDYRMAAQTGEDLLFGDPHTDELILYRTADGSFTTVGTAAYYQLNFKDEFHPVLNADFSLSLAALDKNNNAYIRAANPFGTGNGMNVAGERIYYIRTSAGGREEGIAWH